MTPKLFDPTAPTTRQGAQLAPRPAALSGLRLGLVENTKFNSEALLRRLAERLGTRHDLEVTHVDRKRSPSHAVTDEAIALLRRKADLVVSGVGD